MEFLRFGSSIPGSYWGCCAMCVIQNFKFDPDAKASIEIVDGDGGNPIGDKFAGLTYKEIFETRLRIGTFSDSDMPNHGFLAILTESQVHGGYGERWLKILYENGFEFIRTVDNSVYSGACLEGQEGSCDECYDLEECECYTSGCDSVNKNYLFALFRNIGNQRVLDQFDPPHTWKQLTGGVKQVIDYLTEAQRTEIQASQDEHNLQNWNRIGKPTFYTRAEVEAAGVTVTLAGTRSKMPQQPAAEREEYLKSQEGKAADTPAKKGTPFGSISVGLVSVVS